MKPIDSVDKKDAKVATKTPGGNRRSKKEVKGVANSSSGDEKTMRIASSKAAEAMQDSHAKVKTIIYVHGIGNKPPAAVLKCQWDHALFGVELGDRSRLAYWVDPEFYPVPTNGTCNDSDIVKVDDDQMSTKAVLALSRQSADADQAVASEIDAIAKDGEQKILLETIAAKIEADDAEQQDAFRALDVEAKILPLPPFLRRIITQITTRAFLRDVHEFLFNERRRQEMENSLLDRLAAGGGPFIVIGHSQGSMIAYDVLRRLSKAQCDVRLFLTIGSPLGISEVKDMLGKWNNNEFRVPDCVTRWVNIADQLDPVAADPKLANEYAAGPGQSMEDLTVDNLDSPRHPHSGTGYLRTSAVQEEVFNLVGNAFGQPVAKAVIAKDLVERMENGLRAERHPTLIQLSTSSLVENVDEIGRKLEKEIEGMVIDGAGQHTKQALHLAQIDRLKRYISANLTRSEIERLRTTQEDLKIERIWRNSEKRALIFDSRETIQCGPAVAGYGATGKDIGWAILDTGIRADHPHFKKHSNVKAQWDCTQTGKAVAYAFPPGKNYLMDEQGHGTHVAGIIAGECQVKLEETGPLVDFSGMAPQTSLYGFRVLDKNGNGRDAWIIKALDKIADINDRAGRLVIAGVNLSLGGNFDPSVYGCGHSPICQELRRLWGQGVLVCVAAGNEGYAMLQASGREIPSNMDLSIGDPANLDEAIAVGSIHKLNPHTYGVSYFSSRGPTADGRVKPDLVAPGERILSALHKFNGKSTPPLVDDLYVEMSGTSMATPHVSGLLAGFLSRHKEFIGAPNTVKKILLENCTSLNRDRYIQGAGMPNAIRMLSNT